MNLNPQPVRDLGFRVRVFCDKEPALALEVASLCAWSCKCDHCWGVTVAWDRRFGGCIQISPMQMKLSPTPKKENPELEGS